jgi:hypothetical protein
LLHSNEEEELLIPALKVSVKLSEGDIVCISKADSDYLIEVPEIETGLMKDRDSSLLEKLKNKK